MSQRSTGKEVRERQSRGREQHKQRHRGMEEFGVLETGAQNRSQRVMEMKMEGQVEASPWREPCGPR